MVGKSGLGKGFYACDTKTEATRGATRQKSWEGMDNDNDNGNGEQEGQEASGLEDEDSSDLVEIPGIGVPETGGQLGSAEIDDI